jgi:hypothetical protein
MHAKFFNELALAADAIQIANQQSPQQQLWIDRWTTSVTIGCQARLRSANVSMNHYVGIERVAARLESIRAAAKLPKSRRVPPSVAEVQLVSTAAQTKKQG